MNVYDEEKLRKELELQELLDLKQYFQCQITSSNRPEPEDDYEKRTGNHYPMFLEDYLNVKKQNFEIFELELNSDLYDYFKKYIPIYGIGDDTISLERYLNDIDYLKENPWHIMRYYFRGLTGRQTSKIIIDEWVKKNQY